MCNANGKFKLGYFIIMLKLQQHFILTLNWQHHVDDGRCLPLPSDYMKPAISSNRSICVMLLSASIRTCIQCTVVRFFTYYHTYTPALQQHVLFDNSQSILNK